MGRSARLARIRCQRQPEESCQLLANGAWRDDDAPFHGRDAAVLDLRPTHAAHLLKPASSSNECPAGALYLAVLPYIASTRSTRGSTRFSATLRWNARRARAAALKTWMAGRVSAAAVTPEQLAASPASLLGGSFCRLPAPPLETTDAAAAGGARMAARPQGGRLDRRGEPLRPAFSGGRGLRGRRGHRGLCVGRYTCRPPFHSCASGEFCTRVYCSPDRVFRSVVRKDATRC